MSFVFIVCVFALFRLFIVFRARCGFGGFICFIYFLSFHPLHVFLRISDVFFGVSVFLAFFVFYFVVLLLITELFSPVLFFTFRCFLFPGLLSHHTPVSELCLSAVLSSSFLRSSVWYDICRTDSVYV